MKRPLAKIIPLLMRGMAPGAAVASGLLSPLALGASGDLDPAFADVGRLGPITNLDGPAWSVQSLDGDEILFAGGNLEVTCVDYCYYNEAYLDATNFLGLLTDTGSPDLNFAAAELAHTQVFDVALQPDGKVVAVGHTIIENRPTLTVFRLTREGALDSTFGDGGIFRLPASQGTEHKGTSVVLDPDGRIVVAGPRTDNTTGGELIVLRLLENGVLDDSFGTSGILAGPSSAFLDSAIHIL